MYASNEDEFNREDDDWVFLRQTPPTTTVLHGAVNLVDHEESNLSSSSSSSSSSSKSHRSDSSSSLSSTEHEQVQNDQQENHLLNENPVLTSHSYDDNNALLSTGEVKKEEEQEEVRSSETMIKQDNEQETSPVINEYDLFNSGFDLNNESIQPSNNLRQRTGADVQQTEIAEQHPLTAEHERSPSTVYYHSRPRRNKAYVAYGFLILIVVVQVILNRVISSQRLTINKLTEELEITNQRLDGMKTASIENIEQKLAKQFEDKFQKLINQKLIEFDQEKFSLVLQINELYHIINLTQQNLTHSIHQLSDENERLQEQVTALEHRLQITEEHGSKEKETCPEGTDCTKSSIPSLDVLLGTLIKQTASIAEDTSVNLSGLFEQLSASVSDLVDHGHDYVEESKRKITDFAGSPTAEQVQTTLRRGVENLSSSLRKAQSTYSKWLRTRAQQREQARMDNTEQEQKSGPRPWRWTFQRSHDREQMRHQTPVTKKHQSNKDYVCHSKCPFPVNHICKMKNWVDRFFRP